MIFYVIILIILKNQYILISIAASEIDDTPIKKTEVNTLPAMHFLWINNH